MSNLIPDGWLKTQYSNVLDGKLTNGLYKHADFYGHGDAKILDIAYLFSQGKRTIEHCSPIELTDKERLKYKLDKGDILFNRVSVKPEGVGQNILVEEHNFDLVYESNIIRSTLNKKLTNPRFMSFLLNSETIRKSIFLRAKITAQASIGQEDLQSLELLLPPLPEQQKIAAILTSVDDVIEKTQVQIDKLKDLKTGMMQELLTRGVGVDGKPHTEFKDSPVGRIPKGWDVVSLATITSVITKGATPTTSGHSYTTEGTRFYRSVNASETGVLQLNDVKFITDEAQQQLKRSNLKKGDLVLSIVGAKTGRTYFIINEESPLPANINQNIALIRPIQGTIQSEYLQYIIPSSLFQLQVDQEITTQAQPSLSLKQVGEFLIPLPDIEEQKRIARHMGSITIRLIARYKKLEKMNALKKALMQDLLTGKVRVKVDS